MSNNNSDLIKQLINQTIILQNEINKLNNRLHTRVVRDLVDTDKLDNSLLFNTNSYKNKQMRYTKPFNIHDGKFLIDFD